MKTCDLCGRDHLTVEYKGNLSDAETRRLDLCLVCSQVLARKDIRHKMKIALVLRQLKERDMLPDSIDVRFLTVGEIEQRGRAHDSQPQA